MPDNMFNDMHDSFNRKYKLTNVLNVPIHISCEYDKEGIINKTTAIDKIKIGSAFGLLMSVFFYKYYMT